MKNQDELNKLKEQRKQISTIEKLKLEDWKDQKKLKLSYTPSFQDISIKTYTRYEQQFEAQTRELQDIKLQTLNVEDFQEFLQKKNIQSCDFNNHLLE